MPQARVKDKQGKSAKWQARRHEIVDVSAKVFAERGYHATSTTELCEANGIGKGALYYYIGSKEQLLTAGAAGDAGRGAARRHLPLSRPRLGVPARLPRADRQERRDVPPAAARLRAAGRGSVQAGR